MNNFSSIQKIKTENFVHWCNSIVCDALVMPFSITPVLSLPATQNLIVSVSVHIAASLMHLSSFNYSKFGYIQNILFFWLFSREKVNIGLITSQQL